MFGTETVLRGSLSKLFLFVLFVIFGLGTPLAATADMTSAGLNSTANKIVIFDGAANADDYATAISVQPDGKILAGGGSSDGSKYGQLLLRYNADLTPDTSFGSNGSVVYNGSGSGSDSGRTLLIQDDGKMLTAGTRAVGSNYSLLIGRYNTNGSLDTSFGSNGTATLNSKATTSDYGFGAVLQPDGKIVVTGYNYDSATYLYSLILARFNANGTLDTTFGTNGVVVYNGSSNGYDTASSLALQSDGKLVAAGYRYDSGGNQDFLIVRFNANGSVDTSFGTNGAVKYNGAANKADTANALLIQSDGKVLVAGRSYNGANQDILIIRLNTNGTVDTTFGTNGAVTYNSSGNNDDNANSLALRADGKLIVGGTYNDGINNQVLIMVLNADGTLDSIPDTTFNRLQARTSDSTYNCTCSAATVKPNGDIYAAGRCQGAAYGVNNAYVAFYSGGSTPVTPATPSNDDIQDASLLNDISATGGNLSGSNVGATRQVGDDHPFITGQPEEPYHANFPPVTSVWYKWKVPYSQTAIITTLGSDFDTVLAVYVQADGDYMDRVTSNDDVYEGILSSAVSFDAIKDKTYYIAVSGKNNGKTEGNIELAWLLAPEVIPAVVLQKIASLTPNEVNIGDVDQNGFKTITVNGENFTADSEIYIDGFSIKLGSTTFRGDSTKLEASIPASYLVVAQTLRISVRTGSNVSNRKKLYVVKAVEILAPVGEAINAQIAGLKEGMNLDLITNNLGTAASSVAVTFFSPSAPLSGAVGNAIGDFTVKLEPANPFAGSIQTLLNPSVPVPSGSRLIGLDGATLIGNDGGTLVGNDGATLFSDQGAGMVAAGGGNRLNRTPSAGNGWFFVKSSGGTAPTITNSQGDDTTSGAVAVTFDETSTPKLSELSNMVLALVVDPKLSPCDATLSSSTLLLTVPILTFDVYTLWANFKYVPGTLDWALDLNSLGFVEDASIYSNCAPSTLSPDFKLHIPAVTFSGGSYSLDFEWTHDLAFTLFGIGVN